MTNKEIGKRIRDTRKKRHMSMKRLGEIVGLHESTISRYEQGDIKALDIDKLKQFSEALDVSSSYLIGWDIPDDLLPEILPPQRNSLDKLATNKNITDGEWLSLEKLFTLSNEDFSIVLALINSLSEKANNS